MDFPYNNLEVDEKGIQRLSLNFLKQDSWPEVFLIAFCWLDSKSAQLTYHVLVVLFIILINICRR